MEVHRWINATFGSALGWPLTMNLMLTSLTDDAPCDSHVANHS